MVLVASMVLFSVSCKKDKKPTDKPDPTAVFDKQALLVNMADNIIIPCYADFKTALENLKVSFTSFENSGSQADFQTTKEKLHLAYLSYQRVSLFGFGPGEDASIRANFNVFPANTSLINSNISSGSYDFKAISNIAAKGFPALDYLFYGLHQTETDQMQLFLSDNKRTKYVNDLLNEMSGTINSVIISWNNSYRSTFINSLGTDVGSSIGFLINQINYELDYLKNAKVGIPLGLKSAGKKYPEYCEAYFGGQSLTYAIETLSCIENMYLGKSFSGNDGKGFDDYVDHLGITYANGTLNSAIKNQFNAARTKLNAMANPLSVQIESDSQAVTSAYQELVKLLVLLKTDLPSNLGVVITYQDGDGD